MLSYIHISAYHIIIIKQKAFIFKPSLPPTKFNCFIRKGRKKVLQDQMPEKTLGGSSSVERVINSVRMKDTNSFDKGGGRMPKSAFNAKKQNSS